MPLELDRREFLRLAGVTGVQSSFVMRKVVYSTALPLG